MDIILTNIKGIWNYYQDLKMLSHLSVKKKTPYRMLVLESTSLFSANMPPGIWFKDIRNCCYHTWEKVLKRLPSDLKGVPPTPALISQEIKPTCHCPEAGS